MPTTADILAILQGKQPDWAGRVISPLGRKYHTLPEGITLEEPENSIKDHNITPQELRFNLNALKKGLPEEDYNINSQKTQSPYDNIISQAKALNSQAMSLPQSPNTGSHFKDFLINSLNTAPMAMGFRGGPMARPSTVTSSALSKMPGVENNLGVAQPSGAGIAENGNLNNPRVNQILEHLNGRELPIRSVTDASPSPEGVQSTYITAINPTNNKPIRIRVPQDDHTSNYHPAKTFVERHGEGSYYDLGKSSGGGKFHKSITQNESGEAYGKDPQLTSLFDAIDKVTGKNLIPEGRGPNLPKENIPTEIPTEIKPNQSDLFDSHYPNDDWLKNFKPSASTHEGFDWAPGAKQPFSMEPTKSVGEPSNTNFHNTWKEPSNNIIDADLAFKSKQVEDNVSKYMKAFDEAGLFDVAENPSPISPETTDFHRMLNAKMKGNMETPQYSTKEMLQMSKTIDDVLKNFKVAPRPVK